MAHANGPRQQRQRQHCRQRRRQRRRQRGVAVITVQQSACRKGRTCPAACHCRCHQPASLPAGNSAGPAVAWLPCAAGLVSRLSRPPGTRRIEAGCGAGQSRTHSCGPQSAEPAGSWRQARATIAPRALHAIPAVPHTPPRCSALTAMASSSRQAPQGAPEERRGSSDAADAAAEAATLPPSESKVVTCECGVCRGDQPPCRSRRRDEGAPPPPPAGRRRRRRPSAALRAAMPPPHEPSLLPSLAGVLLAFGDRPDLEREFQQARYGEGQLQRQLTCTPLKCTFRRLPRSPPWMPPLIMPTCLASFPPFLPHSLPAQELGWAADSGSGGGYAGSLRGSFRTVGV